MATDLAWTKLRHEMLRAVADGRVMRGLAPSGWGIGGAISSSYGNAKRAVSSLILADLAVIPAGAKYNTPLELTTPGVSALARWDADHNAKEDTDA